MTSKLLISAELQEISPTVAAISTINVFKVPAGYFEQLSSTIILQLEEENPVLFGMAKSPLTVAEGYFDGLAENILAKIKSAKDENVSDEMMGLCPVISRIGNRNVFTVPADYFESFSSGIKTGSAEQAKVISIKKNSGILKYMAAAVVSGLIGLSLFSVLNNKNPANLSAEKIEMSTTLMADAGRIIKENSFNQELESVTDADIEQYLAQNGQDVAAALVASSVDDGNLPAPEAYLLDENTLSEFLNKANLN